MERACEKEHVQDAEQERERVYEREIERETKGEKDMECERVRLRCVRGKQREKSHPNFDFSEGQVVC